MTVKELKESFEKFPDDTPVLVIYCGQDGEDGYALADFEVGKFTSIGVGPPWWFKKAKKDEDSFDGVLIS